jgi:hypothetical protein
VHQRQPAQAKSMSARKFRVLRKTLLASLLVLVMNANATGQVLREVGQKLGLVAGEFSLQESGYWTCDAGPRDCVYWIDNERVIFNGSHPTDFQKTEDGRRVWRHGVYIWDLRKNTVTKHTDADQGSLCFVDGYIRYRRTEGNDVLTLAGPLGKEVEIERRTKGHYPKPDPQLHGWNTRLSCHRYLPKIDMPLLGSKVALRTGDGFLYFGTMNDPAPAWYFRDGASHGIELPVQRWKITSGSVTKSDFDDSYIFFGPYRESEKRGINLCPPKPVQRHIYRLTRDGKLSTISIPADPRLRCYVSRYAVLRNGVAIQMAAGHATDLDLSILYLLRRAELREVVHGVVTEKAVSPNGCLLAVGISSNADKRKPISAPTYRGHLKVIDFCPKGVS